MLGITIGIFGEDAQERKAIAEALAKKSTPEDITLYQTVYSGKIVTAIDPTRFPEKIDPIIFTAYLCDYCIIQASSLSPRLGEMIVTLDLLGKNQGCIISNLDLKPLVKGTSLENFECFGSFLEAREKILSFEANRDPSKPVFGSIDHSFEVKGVGSILLGFLHAGKIQVHDRLRVHPSGKEMEIRSIQIHDEDVPKATAGDRFGLSIKLLASRDVGRGNIISGLQNNLLTENAPEFSVELSGFSKIPLKDGEQVHAFHFLEDAPCRWAGGEIAGGKTGRGKLIFDKPFSFNPLHPIILARLDSKGLRPIGRATPSQ